MHVIEAKGFAVLGTAGSEISGTVMPHHLAALHALAVAAGHSPAQEADRCGLMLVPSYLHVGPPRGIGGTVNRDVYTIRASAGRGALLPVVGGAVADDTKVDKLLDIKMDHASGILPLVALH